MKRIYLFLVTCAAVLIGTALLWLFSLGRYDNRAENWVLRAYLVKEHHAEQSPAPRILIVSGSNSLFGIDSETLEALLHKPVVNLATHGSLGLDFHLKFALKQAQAGDLVIVPLEYAYYSPSVSELSDWQVTNMESWGVKFVDWDFWTLVRYFRHSSIFRTFQRLKSATIPLMSKEEILAIAEKNSASIFLRSEDVGSTMPVNSRGDLLMAEPASGPDNFGYPFGKVSGDTIKQLKNFQIALEKKHATLRLTWPVTMKNPGFDLSLARDIDRTEKLRSTLEEAGLPMICDARNFQFERRLFLDSIYHLTAEGAILRTEALAACLQNRPPDKGLAAEIYRKKKALADAAYATRTQQK
ncbi:MAG: hypothetical protein K2X60_02505 [Xanthobacteraceae bacterium]|nr:hypothetical protein [Xanthobacteraceae bacterium]